MVSAKSSNNQQYIKLLEEIERCTRLYEGFAHVAPLVTAVYESVYKFFDGYRVTPQLTVEPKEAADRMRTGRSLEVDFDIDTKDVIELLKRISEALAEVNPKLKGTVKELKESIERFALNSPAKVTKNEIWHLRDSLINDAILEQDLATFLFSTMLSSFYRQFSQSIAGVLRTDLWEGGNCPLCGEKPHYGLLRPKDGAKELECWLCGTRWLHPRIKCPFCGNEKQEELGYFTADNREICRINYCKQCHQYCKMIDTRKFETGSDVFLPVHNLATLSYDLLARQEGFTPGSGLEWVNLKAIAGKKVVV